MSIQLLCVSHKTADTKIRGLFAFDDDAKLRINGQAYQIG